MKSNELTNSTPARGVTQGCHTRRGPPTGGTPARGPPTGIAQWHHLWVLLHKASTHQKVVPQTGSTR